MSGVHAEFVIDDEGVLVRDLGSTNGTRVGAERISERRLAHGDQVLLGNVRMLFIDAKVDDAPPPTARSAVDTAGLTGSPEAAGEGVRTISAEKVARAGKRSIAAIAIVVVLAAGGAGAWLWLGGKGGGPGKPSALAVEPPAGNLLASGYSFEGGAGGWTGTDGAPAAFATEARSRHAGESGLAAELEAGEWALEVSPAVPAPRGRALRVEGWLRARDGARGRIGIRFESGSGGAQPTTSLGRAGRGRSVAAQRAHRARPAGLRHRARGGARTHRRGPARRGRRRRRGAGAGGRGRARCCSSTRCSSRSSAIKRARGCCSRSTRC